MIIPNARKVRTADPRAYAWTGLRKFQNVDLITDDLIRIHRLEPRWRENARKQAQQIRYCIVQGREYFAAAQAVSLATKPNLLYYGIMSLALAEILFKQSGDSSLDKARGEHRHHGLTMTVGGIPRGADLAAAAGQLRALPMEIDGKRKGTFELWHRSSREHPVAGDVTEFLEGGGSTSSYAVIMGAVDSAYPPIPISGITLAECFSASPLMAENVSIAGLPIHFVRGRTQRRAWVGPGRNWRANTTVTLHPSPLNAALIEGFQLNPNDVMRVNLTEVGTGYVVTLNDDWINLVVGFPMPPASTVNTEEWRLWTNTPPLNEFGYLYVALFLAGNYARYYPDLWLQDVERSSALALAIEELCAIAEWRAPWLALCELGMNLIVNEA